jgi:hypothetical protein
MPSASDELRAEWGGQDGIGEDKAMAFLKEKGWHLSETWYYNHPTGHEPTEEEWRALDFLIQEWDFGYHPPVEVK